MQKLTVRTYFQYLISNYNLLSEVIIQNLLFKLLLSLKKKTVYSVTFKTHVLDRISQYISFKSETISNFSGTIWKKLYSIEFCLSMCKCGESGVEMPNERHLLGNSLSANRQKRWTPPTRSWRMPLRADT